MADPKASFFNETFESELSQHHSNVARTYEKLSIAKKEKELSNLLEAATGLKQLADEYCDLLYRRLDEI